MSARTRPLPALIRVLSTLVILATSVAGGGCAAADSRAAAARSDPAHNARNSLDWAGTYRGMLPCADCPGIETVVTLASDGTYQTLFRHLGMGDRVFAGHGRLSWNAAGNTITLKNPEPARYFVAENRLIRLAPDGSRITGEFAEGHVLNRVADGVAE